MSTTTAPRIALGGEPRVDLLPPEVVQRERVRVIRGRLLAGVVVVLLLVGAGYAAAWFAARQAESRLTEASARTDQLLAEQATYQPVTDATSALAAIGDIQVVGTSGEVLWRPVIDQLLDALPEGATVETIAATGRLPWEGAVVAGTPLVAEPVVVTFQLTIATGSAPDVADLRRDLSAVAGFVGASIGTVAGADGSYSSTLEVDLGVAALSGRFAPPVEGADAAVDPAAEAPADPAAQPEADAEAADEDAESESDADAESEEDDR